MIGMKSISIVVPVFNEEENIKRLHDEILGACQKLGTDFEIIFVDDGSRDKTAEIAKTLSPLTLIRMRKNFGQTAAMDAGIKAATQDYIITMDGDCQNDPADIPRMIEALETSGADVVSGWRKNRKDTFMKRFVSRGANMLRSILVKDDIHDSGCSLKIYRRECFDGVNLYGEMHRFIPALLKIRGFKIDELVVNHRPRTAGITKYNWKRTIKGLLDMVALWFWKKYAVRPLHMLGGVALMLMGLGFLALLAGGILMCFKLLWGGYFFFGTLLFWVMGAQCIIFGLLADMISKNTYDNSERTYYNVKETITNHE